MNARQPKSVVPFDVEWKAAAGGSTGELEGYIASFGTLDLGNDIVQPGAFKKTFADWSRAKAPLPLMVDHDLTHEGVIGVVTAMSEDAYGAKVRARFASNPTAQDVRQKMIELGGSGMSFSYIPIKFRESVRDGQPVRLLDEVKALEATVTWVPMNAMAYAAAKSAVGAFVEDDTFDLASWYKSMAFALQITQPRAKDAAVAELIAEHRINITAADAPDGDVTATAAAEDGTADDDSDNYASRFVRTDVSDDYSSQFVSTAPEPPDEALNDPLAPLESDRFKAAADAAEARILNALGGQSNE